MFRLGGAKRSLRDGGYLIICKTTCAHFLTVVRYLTQSAITCDLSLLSQLEHTVFLKSINRLTVFLLSDLSLTQQVLLTNVPRKLFDDGYRFVSFDFKSLFTNVPLNKNVNIILNRIYKSKLISTTLTKRTLKKLILDSCTKIIFSLNGEYYKKLVAFLWDHH